MSGSGIAAVGRDARAVVVVIVGEASGTLAAAPRVDGAMVARGWTGVGGSRSRGVSPRLVIPTKEESVLVADS
jgi:hypothetical protein